MPEKKKEKIISALNTIQPLPAAVQKLLSLLQDPKANANDIARVMSNDPTLTARILRITNSSFFGLSHRISTVPQAITILGFQGLRNLALGVAIFSHFKQAAPTQSVERVWAHSLGVASAARLTAARFKLADPDEMFVAGLMHDIGKLLLVRHFESEYTQLLAGGPYKRSILCQLEKNMFGVDHAQLGSLLCQFWKIPEKLTNLVARHHDPLDETELSEKEYIPLMVIKIANDLTKIIGMGDLGGDMLEMESIGKAIGSGFISCEFLRQIALQLPEEIKKVEVFFEVAKKLKDQPESVKPPAVAVLIGDVAQREVVALALINMGYTLRDSDQMVEQDPDLMAVLADESITGAQMKMLVMRRTPILDFGLWRRENLDSASGDIPLADLKAWLVSILSTIDPREKNV
ncbi:HDOD domain-containing protein [bacterium]|nr:HDOD domain-containing protein [bacterium]